MTPYLRTPCLLKMPAMRQAIFTALRNFSCCASSPMAESPTVPGQTGATSEPTAKPLLAMRSAIFFSSSSLRLGIRVREEEEIVDALEFLAVDVRGGGEIEHVLEADGRLLAGAVAFADEAGPHGVVQFREGVGAAAHRMGRFRRGQSCRGGGAGRRSIAGEAGASLCPKGGGRTSNLFSWKGWAALLGVGGLECSMLERRKAIRLLMDWSGSALQNNGALGHGYRIEFIRATTERRGIGVLAKNPRKNGYGAGNHAKKSPMSGNWLWQMIPTRGPRVPLACLTRGGRVHSRVLDAWVTRAKGKGREGNGKERSRHGAGRPGACAGASSASSIFRKPFRTRSGTGPRPAKRNSTGNQRPTRTSSPSGGP